MCIIYDMRWQVWAGQAGSEPHIPNTGQPGLLAPTPRCSLRVRYSFIIMYHPVGEDLSLVDEVLKGTSVAKIPLATLDYP